MEWTVAPEAPPAEAPTMPEWVVAEPEPAVVEPAEPLAPELPAIEPDPPAVEPEIAPDLPAIEPQPILPDPQVPLEPWEPTPLAPNTPPTIEPLAPQWEPLAPWSPVTPQPSAWPVAPAITQAAHSDPLGWLRGLWEPRHSQAPAPWSSPAPFPILDALLLPFAAVGSLLFGWLSFDWLFGPSGRSYRPMPHVTFAVESRHGAMVHYHLVNVRKFPVSGETYTDDDEFIFNVPIRVSGQRGVAGALDELGIQYRRIN